MDLIVKCVPSAFKHGLTEKSIRYAIFNHIYDSIYEGDSEKRLLIGFDGSGNLLEIMYNDIDGQTLNVFHAMKCRNTFLSLLNS